MSAIIVKSAGPQLFTSCFFFRSLAQCCPKLKCLCVLLCIPNIEEGKRAYLTKGNSKAKTIKLEDLPNCFCLGLYLSIPHGRTFKHHPFRLWFCFPDIQTSSFLYILSQDTLYGVLSTHIHAWTESLTRTVVSISSVLFQTDANSILATSEGTTTFTFWFLCKKEKREKYSLLPSLLLCHSLWSSDFRHFSYDEA